ncbi:MAG: hypothetical protein M3346_04430, partial [Actinomycetota bacterium]|nr:hypothetical protein [Actinomycetota bacterium]
MLETALPEGLLAYADRRLLGPLRCSGWTWPADTEGIPYGFGHLQMSPLDLATFGRLWLNRGTHENSGLIEESFVADAWTPASGGGARWCGAAEEQDLNPALNSIQTLVFERSEGGWRV